MAIDDCSRENEEVDSYNEEEPLSETFGEDIDIYTAKFAHLQSGDDGLEDISYGQSSLSDKIDQVGR